MTNRKYKYLVNSVIMEYDAPMYFFVWTINGGHVPFGIFSTEATYLAKRDNAKAEYNQVFNLLKMEPLDEVNDNEIQFYQKQ